MTADRLLRLYPRAWRERYGDEFLATIGDEALRLQQIIDIVAGAIDAWLSSEMRRAGRPNQSSQGAQTMTHAWKAACGTKGLRFTNRDALIGAGVMLLLTFVLSALGVLARRNGMTLTADMLLSLAFPGSLMVTMPFTFMKGQPWKAQAVIIGGTLTILLLIAYLSTLI